MKKKEPSTPEIREGASGAFFVKLGENSLGGFHSRNHAELFLKSYTGELEKEISARTFAEGAKAMYFLISSRDIAYKSHPPIEIENPYSVKLPHIYDVDAPDLIP
jgi:hypothetical protein